MNPAIGRFLRDHSDTEINLEIVLRYEVELKCSERAFDVGIIALPLKHASLVTEPLLDMPMTAIMRRDHPLAKRTFVRVTEITDQKLVTTPPGTPVRQEVEAMFAGEGFELRPQLTVSQVDVACDVVLHTDAVMISDPLIPLTLNPEAYAVVPLRPLRLLRLGIVTPALNPDSRLTTLFKLCLREEAKSIKERLTHRFGNLNAPRNREVSRRMAKPRDRALSSKS
jgi:DNA-binding transcriptional LysR family regulator